MKPTTRPISSNPNISTVELETVSAVERVDGEYRVVVLSDVHLGHRKVRAKKIISTLDKILSVERLQHVSAVVITGDLFDRQLQFDSEEAYQIGSWICRLLRNCKRCNVSLRILLGTPSHDCRQSGWVVQLNEDCQINADVKYYDKITVDPLYKDGPVALWIPDEINHDASITYRQALEVMSEYGVSEVDFSFMHGMFRFQEPIRTISSHSEDSYEAITRLRIVIGHHHTHVTNGKIVVPSSTERLRMNEEEEKGHYQFSVINGQVVNEYFIPNRDATIFSTIDVVGLSYKEALAKLEPLRELPDGSNLRLLLTRQCDAFVSFTKLAASFPQFKFTHKLKDIDTGPISSSAIIERKMMTSIRPDTIRSLLEPKFADVPADIRQEIDSILKAVEA